MKIKAWLSLLGIVFLPVLAKADIVLPSTSSLPLPPVTAVTNQFEASFLAHISAVESFRQDGSHVIKFSDGIIQAIPYKGDHLLVASFGLIPNPTDSAKFYKSYSIHAHLFSIASKYLDINPTYAVILQDIELTPGYTYDTDLHNGQLEFAVGYAHKFGTP